VFAETFHGAQMIRYQHHLLVGAQAAKRFFAKALGSSVDSVPHTHQIEEKRTQLTAPEEPSARRSVPRVIKVAKNAASPKAIAELKANGMLPASVELTSASNT